MTGHFKRALTMVDAVAVVMGSMIGSGIFIVSAETARQVGSPAGLLCSWILAGALTVMAALCYSELSAMFPQAGGQYVFLRESWGPLVGFLYGWTLFTVIQSGTIAAVAVAFSKFLGVFVPWISTDNLLISWGPWRVGTTQLIAVVAISLLTIINSTGVRSALLIQTSFTFTKVGALALLVVLGFLSFGKFHGLIPNLATFWQSHDLQGNPLLGIRLVAAIGLAMVGALFSCDAWNNITFAGEEVIDPQKVLPKSLALGTTLVVIVYLLTNLVYLLLLPLSGSPTGHTLIERGIQFAPEDRLGTAAFEIIFGPVGRYLMALAIIISTFGCLNGLILAGPRAYYAMARDGLFFRKAGVLDPHTQVPVFGLVIQGVWTALLAISGTYSNLLEYVVFAALLFYVLTVGAVFILRHTRKDLLRPYKVIGYPWLPALYIVAAAAVMIGQFWLSPKYAGTGLLIILSGLPIFFIASRKRSATMTPPVQADDDS